MRTLIKGGTLALPDGPARADLLTEGEHIAAIGLALDAPDAEVVDARACLVLPGMIDTHTHFDLPVSGTVTADDFESGTRAAILGGTTTVLDFATQDRGGTLRAAYDTWRSRMEGKASCDVGFHMAITDWNEGTGREIGEMAAIGITSFKLYMAYPALMLEDDALYAALRRIAEVGGIAGVHCENGRLVEALTARQKEKGQLGPEGHPASRPPLVEAEAIARLVRIARLAGAAVNIVHLSSRAGLEALHANRAPGQTVYVETCPQYLLLDDTAYSQADGAKYVCSPPLRGHADQAALWQAVEDGEVYTVGTDHCSFRYADQKQRGKWDFSMIPNGLPGVEHRLALMMTAGVDAGRLSLCALTRLLAEQPAKLFGLYPQKGVLRPGSDADLLLWDPARRYVIQASGQAQNVDYTPYEGFETAGGARDVWLRGRRIVANGTLARPRLGHYVTRMTPFSQKN